MNTPETRLKITLDRYGNELYTPQVKRFGVWWNLISSNYLPYTSIKAIAKQEINGYLNKHYRKNEYPKTIKYPEDE